jgi:hypothetical protein
MSDNLANGNGIADLEPMEEITELEAEAQPEASPLALAAWQSCYINDQVPSLYLDRSLKILRVNLSFRRFFGIDAELSGEYFTQFFSSSFDETTSAELFRAIRSADGGYTWHGKVQKIGIDKLLTVSKVWVVPLTGPTGLPVAYSAVCLDMTDEHRQLLQSTFTSLLGAARLKDNDTGNHIERVNRYARLMAMDLMDRPGAPAVDREFVESIGLVAALHDIGKIGTPDDILNKAGQLEAWEWDVMKQHTTNGAYILSTYPNPMAREISLRHHERWDGSGYPHGLSQELIPLSARIVAVSDVYDALRMRRNYKEAYTHAQTMEHMAAERGTHFDPYLIDRFLEIAGSFESVFSELSDSQ